MLKLKWALALLTMIVFATSSYATLPSDVDEASVGGLALMLPGLPLGWNANLAVPYDADLADGYVAAAVQSNGTVVRGQYYAEAGFLTPIYDARVVAYLTGKGIGPGLSDIGFSNDAGINFEFPIKGFDIKGGVFGRSGGSWAAPSAADVLEANGFSPDDLDAFMADDGRTLSDLGAARTGVKIQNRNSLNLRLATEYSLTEDIGGEISVSPELFGDGGELGAVDQARVTLNGSVELGERLNFQWGGEVLLSRERESGDSESEVVGRASINYVF